MPRSAEIFPIIFLTIFFIGHPDASAQISSEELEAIVDAMFSDVDGQSVPGTAIVVVKDGQILLNKGYGLANLEHQVAVSSVTIFDLASVSKQFAGFAISTLVEEGKIDLQDDIRKYIPELPDFGHTVTVDHLVHHTSGIRDWTSTLPLAGWSFDDVISMEQIIRMAQHQKSLNFEPGSQYVYSNTGYNLLAELVYRVTGQSFAAWTKTHIFEPLDMKDTRFLDDHTAFIPNRATGYYRDEEGSYHVATNNLTALGSSSMFSTTTDLAMWAMHLDQPRMDMSSVVERMFTRGILNNGDTISYAFGLSIDEVNGNKWISHGGSWASFRTHLAYLPEHKLSVIVLKNEPANTYQIARDIASLYLPSATPEVNASKLKETEDKVKVDQKILEEYTGTYRLGPGWYVTITRQGDQLWTQATNESNYPMTARSDSLFLIKDYGGRTMTFVRNAEGEITHVKYNDQLNPRVAHSGISGSIDYQAYTGEYVSEELNTSYRVVVENATLKMKHFRHGTLELTPAWNDDFRGSRWFISSVEFQRDADGAVNGFKVWQYRARDQVFKKVR